MWSNLHLERKIKFQIFPIFIFWVIQNNTVAANSFNAIGRKPVPTRVLNSKACEVQGCSSGGGCRGAKPPGKKILSWNIKIKKIIFYFWNLQKDRQSAEFFFIIFPILFSTFRNFHQVSTISERRKGGVCILLSGKRPQILIAYWRLC